MDQENFKKTLDTCLGFLASEQPEQAKEILFKLDLTNPEERQLGQAIWIELLASEHKKTLMSWQHDKEFSERIRNLYCL